MQNPTRNTPALELHYIDSESVACDGGAYGHPRVFLHVDHETGQVVCPYCSRTYRLKPGTVQLKH